MYMDTADATMKDVERAASLKSSDPYTVSYALTMLSAMTIARSKTPNDLPKAWANMPAAGKQRLAGLIRLLERIGTGSDKNKSAKAWTGLAYHYLTRMDYKKAEEAARQALQRIPDEPGAQMVLVSALQQDKRFAEMLKLSEEWLKSSPTALNYTIRLRAHFEMGNLAEAETALQEARQRFPDDLMFEIYSVTMLLKKATDEAGLKQVMDQINRAYAGLSKGYTIEHQVGLNTMIGVYYALTDDYPKSAAFLATALASEPDSENIKALLAIVNEMKAKPTP
jgi:tetratricopeptide (TPR) repeat protein